MQVVGTPSETSRICYLVGCNAGGQVCLSAAGTLTSALVGTRHQLQKRRAYPDSVRFDDSVGRDFLDQSRKTMSGMILASLKWTRNRNDDLFEPFNKRRNGFAIGTLWSCCESVITTAQRRRLRQRSEQ